MKVGSKYLSERIFSIHSFLYSIDSWIAWRWYQQYPNFENLMVINRYILQGFIVSLET